MNGRQWYHRRFAMAVPELGLPELPDCPVDVFLRLLTERERLYSTRNESMTREQIKQAGLVEARMRWYKHFTNFRTSPIIKYIRAGHGDSGVVAAHNLYEVMMERFGMKLADGKYDYSGTLHLSPPRTKGWLAAEIGCDEVVLDQYLATFHVAGLIVLGNEGGVTTNMAEVTTITLPNARTLAAEWQAKGVSKAQRKGQGGCRTPE